MAVFLTGAGVLPDFSKALSDYAVGESVFLNVNGAKTEFLVVQQGLPSSDYDASCNGTWLLMKGIYELRQFHSSDANNYKNSTIHAYLNGNFLGLFDSGIQSLIKQVRIPYRNGTGTSNTYDYGSSGLSTKIFLLSYNEVGFVAGDTLAGTYTEEGDCLEYFSDDSAKTKRIAYYNDPYEGTFWWLRTPVANSNTNTFMVFRSGNTGRTGSSADDTGIRPCIIIPSDTKFDPDTNEVIA